MAAEFVQPLPHPDRGKTRFHAEGFFSGREQPDRAEAVEADQGHAAGNLQRAGLIRYKRGRIDVLDRPQLEKTVCECYAVVKAEFDRLLSDIPRENAPRDIDRPAGKAKRR